MIEIFAAIIGVVVGWALNEITDSLHKKPKLCFRMVSTPTNELTDKEYRTKLACQSLELRCLILAKSL